MISSETIQIRAIRRQLLDIAERLDGGNIGTTPITKLDASNDLYLLADRLLALEQPTQATAFIS